MIKYALAILWLGLWLLLMAGCTVTGTRTTQIASGPQPYTGMGVPPSFYNNDPALEYWYTPPYFNPYIGHR
jgi:hypothetical protein